MEGQVFPKLPEPITEWQAQQKISAEEMLQHEIETSSSLRRRQFFERRLEEERSGWYANPNN